MMRERKGKRDREREAREISFGCVETCLLWLVGWLMPVILGEFCLFAKAERSAGWRRGLCSLRICTNVVLGFFQKAPCERCMLFFVLADYMRSCFLLHASFVCVSVFVYIGPRVFWLALLTVWAWAMYVSHTSG